jgi:predicted tellurium resistance membrane protein TerC
MEWISQPEAWLQLSMLTLLELVLGIDNILIISILTSKLPKEKQKFARNLGLFLAMFMRAALLFSISWIASMKQNVLELGGMGFSGRDLVLIIGGLFLIYKACMELWEKMQVHDKETNYNIKSSFPLIIAQILVFDLIFSLDSVITAIGVAENLQIMIIAIIIAILFMMFFAGTVSEFLDRYPTLKNLALAFLVLVGIILLIEGFLEHEPGGHGSGIKNYAYVAMGFALVVELVNIRFRKVSELNKSSE